MSKEALQDLIVESDHGARRPSRTVALIIMGTALLWSLFQLWIASPLPFMLANVLHIPVLDETKSRYIHLAFALFLAYLSYPAFKRSPRNYVPIMDWLAALLAAASCLYLFFNYANIASRAGIPTTYDVAVAVIGVVLLIEATRRSLGPPLMIIALIFLTYTFAGSSDFVPDIIRYKGASLNKAASHQWLTTEGVFGIALGVSTSFVFLFVLFGALLEKAGAGNYFIKLAFSLLGHMRGGPAKAAVLSSAMTGIISGSSIANVVTTGTFTIPLMRRVGFTREQAGAVEVGSSVNGQLMPPVMGAAAFLMVEYVGIPYIEVIKHAFLPAVISYVALLYMVHLEAKKRDMPVLPKLRESTLYQSVFSFVITVSSFVILSAAVYYGLGWIKGIFGDNTIYVSVPLVLLVYLGLLAYAAKQPDLELDDPNAPMVSLPETASTFKTGIHFLLPIVVLVWCLMVERLSPGLSAFYATAFMIFILITQHPVKEFCRGSGKVISSLKQGFVDLIDGLITGARNMVGIGIATAVAGIIVGTVSLTGVGQVLTELVEAISGGNVFLILLFTALISLILGMGLPTTANYIVVASLMAKVIIDLGAQNGLIVPAIAVHLFVFYFGIMADVTPPVGLAAFAAAAVSGGDPIRTGIQAFTYSLRTALLPFLFIYDNELLLIGVDSIWLACWIFIKATIAMLLFSSALQGFMFVRNKWHETLMLLAAMLMLLVPQLWINFIVPPYQDVKASEINNFVMEHEPGEGVMLRFKKTNEEGEVLRRFRTFMVIGEGVNSEERLRKYGLTLFEENGKILVEDAGFNTKAEKALGDDFYDFTFELAGLKVPTEQPSKRLMNIPAVVLIVFVVLMQKRREKRLANSQQAVKEV